MTDIVQLLEQWQLDVGDLREGMYRAPTPRERERWHGLWLLAQGWSATQVAEALEREPHTIGNWLDNFRQGGAQGLVFEQTGGPPPVLNRGQQNQLKSAVQNPPGEAGIELSNWNWKVVRQFLKQSFDLGLSRSSCLNYLHRLGFLLQYSQIREEAQESGAKIFFVDEAHFRADADLRGKWVLKGEAALVDSTSPGGREGLLLLGSLSGDWGGGSHGNSWKQQCRDLHRLFTAAKSKLSWTSGSNLGQWTSPPRSSDSQLFDHSELASEVGGLTGLQPRLQCRRSRLGLGQGRGHGQRMPRNKSQSPREDESILRRASSP